MACALDPEALAGAGPGLGAAEAIHARFAEAERTGAVPPPRTDLLQNPHATTMVELPEGPGNSTGRGFPETAERFLYDRGLYAAARAVQQAGLSLHSLLTAADRELAAAGLAFSAERAAVRNLVAAFHRAPWHTLATLKLRSTQGALDVVAALDLCSRLCQQLYVDGCTVAWLRRRLPPSPAQAAELAAVGREALRACSDVLALTQSMLGSVLQLGAHCDDVPVDFIGPQLPGAVAAGRSRVRRLLLPLLLLGAGLVASAAALARPLAPRLALALPWALA